MEDTEASLSADEEFLAMLKEKCSMTGKEWDERQKTRQLEMGAVSKALTLLGSDDAHDQFSKSFNPALLQESGRTHTKLRLQASAGTTGTNAGGNRSGVAAGCMGARAGALGSAG
eukprot:1435907-Lingulodinium_polyedra.AAC.1